MNDLFSTLLGKKKNNSLVIPVEEKNKIIKDAKTNYFESAGFNFIKDHVGFRKGKKHLLIGTTGSGKSTLSRAICLNVARDKKVFWYSTEETFNDMIKAFHDSEVDDSILKNITFFSEYDKEINAKNFIKILSQKIIESESEILFFDNITTSLFYPNGDVTEQDKIFINLSAMVDHLNIPLFIIAHTAGGVKDLQKELFTADNVKGSKTIANKCEYVYAYQLITYIEQVSVFSNNFDNEIKLGFVRVLKSRGGDNSNSVYSLVYNKDKRSYLSDSKISFDKFNSFYEKRIKLGDSPKRNK